MNKFVKIALIVLAVLLVVGIGIYVKLFRIGSKDYSNIRINQVALGNEDVTITGEIMDSAKAFKDFDFKLVGNELYVSITTVLVSKKYSKGSFEIVLPIDGFSLDHIHLSDDKSTEVIFSKE